MAPSWNEIDDRLDGKTVREYGGLIVGAGLEAASKITDPRYFSTYIDPWYGDKILHGWFSKDLTKAVWNSADRLGAYMESKDHEKIASAGRSLQDPYTKTALSFGAIGAFSGMKELVYDANPDGFDVAANYIGFSYYMLAEQDALELSSYYDAVTDKR